MACMCLVFARRGYVNRQCGRLWERTSINIHLRIQPEILPDNPAGGSSKSSHQRVLRKLQPENPPETSARESGLRFLQITPLEAPPKTPAGESGLRLIQIFPPEAPPKIPTRESARNSSKTNKLARNRGYARFPGAKPAKSRAYRVFHATLSCIPLILCQFC